MDPLIKTEFVAQPQIGESEGQHSNSSQGQQVGRSISHPRSPKLTSSSRQAIPPDGARPLRQLPRQRSAISNGRLSNKPTDLSMTHRYPLLAPLRPLEQHISPPALRSNLDMPRCPHRQRLYRATMKSLPPRRLAHNNQSKEVRHPQHRDLHRQSKLHTTCPRPTLSPSLPIALLHQPLYQLLSPLATSPRHLSSG